MDNTSFIITRDRFSRNNNECHQICFCFLYILLLVPTVFNFIYITVLEYKIESIVDHFNETKIDDYLIKTESIIDFVCNTQKIC